MLKPEEMLDLCEWTWSDFKVMFDAIASMWGADCAWRVLHIVWKTRAGEEIKPEDRILDGRDISNLIEFPVQAAKLDQDIMDVCPSGRVYNCLRRAGINIVRDLLEIMSFSDLRRIRNLGEKSREALLISMRDAGFTEWADKMWHKGDGR